MSAPGADQPADRWVAPGYLVAGMGVGAALAAMIGWSAVGQVGWGIALAVGALLVVLGSAGLVWGRGRFGARPTDAAAPGASPPFTGSTPPPVLVPPVPPTAPDVAPAPTPRPSTSIPGAYLAALGPSLDPEPADAGPDPPPIAAALPFAAMARPPSHPSAAGDADEGSPILDVELARLRARVRELDLVRPGSDPSTGAYSVSGASLEIPPSRDRSDARPVPSVGRINGDPLPAAAGPVARRSSVTPAGSETRDPSG